MTATCGAGESTEEQSVVILLPFENRINTTRDLDNAIKSVPFSRNVIFYMEFLDVIRFPDSDHEEALVHYFRAKYASQRVHVVVAAGWGD